MSTTPSKSKTKQKDADVTYIQMRKLNEGKPRPSDHTVAELRKLYKYKVGSGVGPWGGQGLYLSNMLGFQ